MKVIQKPWGREEIWAMTDSYVGKTLFVNKEHKLSLQHHDKKDETIRVISGTLLLQYGKFLDNLSTLILNPGESFHITPGVIHRMIAILDCEIVEVSTIELDDIIRHEDDYGRVKK